MVAEQTSRGLGDTIAKITNFFGIQPCGGCEQRRDVLNRWIPYRDHSQAKSVTNAGNFQSQTSTTTSIQPTSEPSPAKTPRPRIQFDKHFGRNGSTDLIFPDSGLMQQIDAPQELLRDIYEGRSRGELAEIFAARSWRAPGRRRGPADLEGDRRERRTDRRDERDERRTGRRRSTSASSPLLGKTPTTFACGVDVTLNIKAAVRSAKTHFASWSNDHKHQACGALHSFRTGSYAWDILEMHSQVTSDTLNIGLRPQCATSGATPACGSSVTVDNSCHFAGSANYVIFGVMCKLCSDHYSTMLSNASWYELIDKQTYQDGLIQFSLTGMLGLIDLYKKYLPLLMLDSPAGNIDAAKRWSIAGYYGWPHCATTPVPDRSNCTLTCPSATSLPKFNVSWYPHLNPYPRR